MKYYESLFDDYLNSSRQYDLHPELCEVLSQFPKDQNKLKNIILYGPSGVGKYTQALRIISRYSHSNLKYDKRLSVLNEKSEKKAKIIREDKKGKHVESSKKNEYVYRASDVHYEIDMSVLGCNAKTLWHDIYFQIVDVVSVKQNKFGIILCKNFHNIYNELLDVFNSYIRHPLQHMDVKIVFIMLTEHVGYIPDNISNACEMIRVRRPSNEHYLGMIRSSQLNVSGQKKVYHVQSSEIDRVCHTLNTLGTETLVNAKELYLLKNDDMCDLSDDISNIISNNILRRILKPKTINISDFRNEIYDMLIYNIDVQECICFILCSLIQSRILCDDTTIRSIFVQLYTFLKYYNNNYRPIYHLESIFVFIINKIHYNK